jgi:anti-sigma factor RsiW
MSVPPMSNCAAVNPLVTPYVDDQLSDTERELVERHVLACPPCHARVTAERAVHDLIRARRLALNQTCAPRTLHSRCTQHMRGQTQAASDHVSRPAVLAFPDLASRAPQIQHLQPPAPSWRSRIAPLAVAASLVLIVGAAFLYQLTVSSTRVMAAELAADHVKCSVVNAVLHTHDEAAAVESSMLTGFGWKMHLPAEAPNTGLELVGSRPCLYGEGKIAHIMYRSAGEPVSLFMLPETGRAAEIVQVLGHRAAIWCDGKRTFVLVAKQPQQEVERLASWVQASLK